tara:strand:+ start:56132 stop:56584 length:453 start_codon:yes stop_codon:yes gene_type:complete
MESILTETGANSYKKRVLALTSNHARLWGKMTADQMLAHCNAAFEASLSNDKKSPNALVRFIIKSIAKNAVVGEKPFKKNVPTAPDFVIVNERDFELEKERTLDYINQAFAAGENYFEAKKHPVFGTMSAQQWSNLLSKHLDHHLQQFGV